MTTKQKQIENLKNQITNARILQNNASRMQNATGVFNCQRELEALYRKLDAITR